MRIHQSLATSLLILGTPLLVSAKTIFVTSTDTNSVTGRTNLTEAILLVEDGDTVEFHIPGIPGQIHYLECPAAGFPLITKDNVTINGYTQSGATPNSNPLTASNNARIMVVLDARNGNARDMGYTSFDGTPGRSLPPIDNTSMAAERPGYDPELEFAILGIYRATNVTIRGLAFLAMRPEATQLYGIAVAHDYGLNTNLLDRLAYDEGSSRDCHIEGCWFGVDPANPTVAGIAAGTSAITFFRHRDVNNTSRPELPDEGLIIGVAPGAENPRQQFNVIAGWQRSIAGEGVRWRLCGNFVGVLPNGVTPADLSFMDLEATTIDSCLFQNGGYDDPVPLYIGTDGDGVNDPEEGNVFGAFGNPAAGDKRVILQLYRRRGGEFYVIAGNSFGMAVDGTRWTNAAVIIDQLQLQLGAKVRFGSDFNGFSDALEANRVFNNWPFHYQYPSPTSMVPLPFITPSTSSTNGWINLRGNVLVDNAPPPYSPTQVGFTNLYSAYVDPNAPLPVLSTNSTSGWLIGNCGKPLNGFTNLIVDVYLPDPGGRTNGGSFDFPELGGTNGWGFVQGLTWLGAFLDNAPADEDLTVGSFAFNLAALNLEPGTQVTMTCTYSLDPPGTTNGRGMTTAFSVPVALRPPLRVANVIRSGSSVTLTWTGGTGPYVIQRKSALSDPAWSPVATGLVSTNYTFSDETSASFYRIGGN